jgi:hypothetical protein
MFIRLKKRFCTFLSDTFIFLRSECGTVTIMFNAQVCHLLYF